MNVAYSFPAGHSFLRPLVGPAFSYLFFPPVDRLPGLLILSLCSFVVVVILVRTYFLSRKRAQPTYYEKLALTCIPIPFLKKFPYAFSQRVIKL